MAKMSTLDWVALTLVTVGAINWGLLLFDFNLVTAIFSSWLPAATKWVYGLVGLSGLYSLWFMVKNLF